MPTPTQVLVSFVAVNNDPFATDHRGERVLVAGKPTPGPTLTLLLDRHSPHRGKVGDAVLLSRKEGDAREARALKELKAELARQAPDVAVHVENWQGDDPTDHQVIYRFLQELLPRLRECYPRRELVIHASPGTPSMQTIWVLMAETGMIPGPFTLVKSYRARERGSRLAVVPIKLGIETFFKRFAAQPAPSAEDGDVRWDPSRFQSERMRGVFRLAQRFAALRAPVLILGERGTGKTTLASWIRATSPFRKPARDKSWPVVVCGQYAEGTMRGELFGYRKGAFTGATEDHDGLLKAADGDTLFLDEIGDISLDVQRLLIRAVEEGTYTRLGETKPLHSKFRLLAATNRPWPELARDVSRDFLDRVSMLRVELPPLRDVPEELPWLLRDAIKVAAQRASVAMPMLSQATLQHLVRALQGHPLPGNLRDLQLVAYRLLAAMGDAAAPMEEADAVDFALQDLDRDAAVAGEPVAGSPQAIASAFAQGRPLATAFPLGARQLPTREVLEALQGYLASEVRRESRDRRVPVGDLCDVSERTLRNWAKAEE